MSPPVPVAHVSRLLTRFLELGVTGGRLAPIGRPSDVVRSSITSSPPGRGRGGRVRPSCQETECRGRGGVTRRSGGPFAGGIIEIFFVEHVDVFPRGYLGKGHGN